MTRRVEISENGIIWDLDNGDYLGPLPRDFDLEQTLAMFGKLREGMARIEAVKLCLHARGEHDLIEMLDRALLNLEGHEVPLPGEELLRREAA